MELSSQFLLTIGGILLLGLLTTTIAARIALPRVTLLLLFGILIGKEAFNLIPPVFSDHFELIAEMTLLMVGFLLGGKLTAGTLQRSTGKVLLISLFAALCTAVVVSVCLIGVGISIQVAILLGCIASATAPAAILDVVSEYDGDDEFCTLLLSIVALDDVWALILFGIGMTVATSFLSSQATGPFWLLILREIGGAVVLGVCIGFPAAYLTGRIKFGEPILSEALGIVFVCGGLALLFKCSFLIASMVMGTVIANLARHHDYPFHAIEGIERQFMLIFFVLAGASMDIGAVKEIGLAGGVYVLCRFVGKYLGAAAGCLLGRADHATTKWMGVALLPQAGVAIGMALVASAYFPEHRRVLLSIVIGSTVFFEIIGPVFTGLAIRRVRDERRGNR